MPLVTAGPWLPATALPLRVPPDLRVVRVLVERSATLAVGLDRDRVSRDDLDLVG